MGGVAPRASGGYRSLLVRTPGQWAGVTGDPGLEGSGSPGRLRPTLRRPPKRRAASAFFGTLRTPSRRPALGPAAWRGSSRPPEASGRTPRAPLRARQSAGSFCLQQRKRRERALFPKHPKFRGPCFSFPREYFSRTQTTCLHLSLKGSSCDLEKRNRALKRRFTPSLSGHRRASLI